MSIKMIYLDIYYYDIKNRHKHMIYLETYYFDNGNKYYFDNYFVGNDY